MKMEGDGESSVESSESDGPEDDESWYAGGFKTGSQGADIYESKVKKLGDVLGRPYKVPDYQRAYTWKAKSVEDLWHDLTNRYMGNEDSETGEMPTADEYLLGPIVFSKEDKKYYIVDGQQRLVTLTLLFCAIRDAANTFNTNRTDQDRELFKAFTYSINKIAKTDSNNILIELNTDELNSAYRHIVTGNSLDALEDYIKKDPGASRLIGNYRKLLRNAKEFCDTLGLESTGVKLIKRLKKLEVLITDIKNKNVFVHITIDDDSWAPHVFASLNGKSDPLTPSALIKSYLLRTLNVDSNDANALTRNTFTAKWNSIMNKFQTDTKLTADHFLYESALSRRSHAKPPKDGFLRFYQSNITKKHLYGHLKSACKTKNDVRMYIDHLSTDMQNIIYVFRPNTLQQAHPANIKHSLASVNLLNASYIRRPIVAACRKWGVSNRHTSVLANWLHQYFFVDVTVMEKKIDNIKQISKSVVEEITDEKNLLDILINCKIFNRADLVMHDQNFKGRFIQKFSNPIKTLDVAKYILIGVERHLKPNPEIPLPANAFELEHIFPKKPNPKNDEWTNTGLSKQFLDRLGNLTILTPPYNKDVANRGFLYKKGNPNTAHYCYAKSELEINKNYLMKYNTWNEEQILDRERALCDIASDAWRLTHCFERACSLAQNGPSRVAK